MTGEWPSCNHDTGSGAFDEFTVCRALPVWLGLGALHVGLGLALKLYFFRFVTSF